MPIVVIHLKLAAEPAPLPAVVSRSQVREDSSASEIKESNEQAAQVRHMRDAAAGSGERCKEFDCPEDQDEILCRQLKDDEDDDAIRKQQSVRQENSVDCAGCADRRDVGVRRK